MCIWTTKLQNSFLLQMYCLYAEYLRKYILFIIDIKGEKIRNGIWLLNIDCILWKRQNNTLSTDQNIAI